MYLTMTREELRDMLDVSERALKDIISCDNLKKRINDKNYELINTYKVGRNVVYELEPTDVDLWRELQQHYKIKKRKEHTKYSQQRLENGMEKSRSEVIKQSEVSISNSTAKRFDEILVNEKAIKKGPVAYRMYNRNTNEFYEITKEEYLEFWREKRCSKQIMSYAKTKRKKYEISEKDYDFYVSLATQKGEQDGMFAYSFDTYVALKDIEKFIDMIKKTK